MKAAILKNEIDILGIELLPNGVKVITVRCANYAELKKLPKAIMFRDEKYGRSGWNSDRCLAYYRTDKLTATAW
jgi:hypothetical protein